MGAGSLALCLVACALPLLRATPMRTFGLVMLVSGLVSAAALPVLGACCQVPWSAGSALLFGLGVAYAGLCGISSAATEQRASQ